MAWISALYGGVWLLILPIFVWYSFIIIDAFAGLNEANTQTSAGDNQLFWYRLITLIWPPLQFITLYGVIYLAAQNPEFSTLELIGVTVGLGIMTGTIGINYSHELMHQKPKIERWMADALLGMVLYSHFRSEHLLVHHRYVCTPRDPVTARYNEGFYHFFGRVLWQCFTSAWTAEKTMLSRKNLPFWHSSNPFWRFATLQAAFALFAVSFGGFLGLSIFLGQAFIAIFQLELVNYLEHYGLTRQHLGKGKYEHTKPHHSWNAAHRASNWLLINLQRHSDHHYKPDRRFPLLQTYDASKAPQLPYGYPIMTLCALVPPLWRRVMNPKVRNWRKQFYPDISDWTAYNKASNPMPR